MSDNKKMEISKETVEEALEICNEVLNKSAKLIKNMNDKCTQIGKNWKDDRYKEVKKSVDESITSLRTARLDIVGIEQTLKKIREYIIEYDSPIV